MKDMIEWHIGCSGFHYKEWKENFYPKGLAANKWFNYYTNHFNTLEVNATFYRTPRLTTLQKWHDESAANFLFSVKAPRTITHYKKFIDCENEIADFYSIMKEGLQQKLACVLFQFPPGFSYTEKRLNNITAELNPSFRNVIEFRHSSWWNQHVYEQFKKHSISFCNMSHPSFPDTFISTSPLFYFRFHGTPDIYKSSYSTQYLDGVIQNIKNNPLIQSAWLYFNNTAGKGAIENANYLKENLQENFYSF